ncbi:inositol monophosphatase [Streptomyces sp. CHD11]|uniref:inositol monophosphatase family protein n=1 Tax=Streptomyces sp. CHD11 TaxID=2741325 RepID=UPI001BFCA038|nr:inositol monophosphatase [Streptomyces sp. CHD11]MBT3153855.1 inositol monophosphatase [Streptomyces sp. CHD11]
MTDPRQLLTVAEAAVEEAVAWLATAGETWSAARFKASGEEVTAADIEVESRVTRVLAARTPRIPVVGEESSIPGTPLPERCWVLDPIDGTMNFARGAPMYAVSLAYVQDGVPLVGVVEAPVLGRRWATPGRLEGARPVAEDVDRAVVGVSGTGPRHGGARRLLDHLQENAYRVRMQGSMALDLVGVAEGWLDACVCIAPKPWDIAAGAALCRERGRAVLGADGTTFSFDSPVLLAGAPGTARRLAGLWGND